MLGTGYEREVCSMARALEVVGERWSLLIIRDALFAGSTRFTEFQRALGIAPNILTSRLERFVDAGVMRLGDGDRGSEYLLTEAGRDLAGPVVALTAWGDKWATGGEPPIVYRHSGCDGAARPVLQCQHGHEIGAAEVAAEVGPGMPPEFIRERRERRTGKRASTRRTAR